ncbi:hypothetical protein KC722_03055 [Candidatus Kaiserbacteria bacterium]|nr:hypothetical protein [Candidatus Kaiserbacteria bacterium]MCB9811292.1 hypothetical protein [Candidatus Nomurabacteria bacterium]
MEIFFGLLLTLPYLLALLFTYFLSHKLFNKYSSPNFGKASRFFFALGIFLVIGFVIRKIALAGFGLLFSAFGAGVVMGALSFVFGMILGPVVLVVWYGTALYFAVRAAKKVPQPTSFSPGVETNMTGKYRLYILVFAAIVLTVGVPLFSNWYFYSTSIGNTLAKTFNEPRFCKIISYEGSSNECVNNLLSGSELSTSALKCSDFKKDSDNFHECTINKAIETNDSTQCEKMSDYKWREKAECYRNFVGSTGWNKFCSEQDTWDKAIISARCLTTPTVDDLFASRFLDGVSAPAWFNGSVIPNYRSEGYGDAYAQETRDWLKDLGVDPNTRDSIGRTLLMFMMRFQSNDVSKNEAQIVLDFGVDIDALDNKGDSAFDYAVRSGNLEVIDFIVENSSKIYVPKTTDIGLFLESDDTCNFDQHQRWKDAICIYGDDKGDRVAREYINRGWLVEYAPNKVRVADDLR